MKNTVKILINITTYQKKSIKKIAEHEGLTFSDKLRRILDEYLDRYFDEKK